MESPHDTDERVESVPWEHIARPDDTGRRRLVVVAVAVLVAAVTASATRTLWPSPPMSALPSTTVPAPEVGPIEPVAVQTVPETPARPVTEADLRAIAPDDAARAVSAHAQWYVTEWLTVDGTPSAAAEALTPAGLSIDPIEESARSFVESAIVLSASEVSASVWEVAVLVRTLSSLGDGEYVRVPPRVFLVTVGIGDAGPFVLDLPTPGRLPIARPPALDLVEADAPDVVFEAGLSIMAEAGLVDEATVSAAEVSGSWRLRGVVRDPAGVPFEVVVWLDDTGARVPVTSR